MDWFAPELSAGCGFRVMVVVILLPIQKVGVGPVGVIVNVTVTGDEVVLVKVVLVIFPEPLLAMPVTVAVLSLVQAKVVPATLLLVLNVKVLKAVPEQIVWLLLVEAATGIGLTVMVTVPVICTLHKVVLLVANTL
jgi:hypothetical protein